MKRMEQLIIVFIHSCITCDRWSLLSYGFKGKSIVIAFLWPAESVHMKA